MHASGIRFSKIGREHEFMPKVTLGQFSSVLMEGFAFSCTPQSVHRSMIVRLSRTQVALFRQRSSRTEQARAGSSKGGREIASSPPFGIHDDDPASSFGVNTRNVSGRHLDQLRRWTDRIRALPSSGRSVALAQLLRLEQEGAYSGLVGGSPDVKQLDGDALFDPGAVQRLSPADRRHVTELVAGVTRWRRRLSWILEHLPKPTNISSMDLPLQVLLLMATYEILVLDMAPHAVNEYVEIAKITLHKGCGGVANGVLRTLLRSKAAGTVPHPPLPVPESSDSEFAEAAALATSHPTWMVRRWAERFGKAETLAFLKENNKRPRHCLRVNGGIESFTAPTPSIGDTQIAPLHPSRFLPSEFLVIESGALQRILSSGIISKGQAQIQDEAAGLVVAMLQPTTGDRILDCCAAPGGKTLFAAARMAGRGRLVALDVSASRLKALMNTAGRQGVPTRFSSGTKDFSSTDQVTSGSRHEAFLTCVAADARQYCRNAAAANEVYDRVLVDAPCSGTGVLAKRADLRWRRRPEDLTTLCKLQAELLDAASEVVRPGGVLVYATCSVEAEENEDIIHEFLQRHPEFTVEMPEECIPSECLTSQGFLRMLPHVHHTDGAFAAKLRRRP